MNETLFETTSFIHKEAKPEPFPPGYFQGKPRPTSSSAEVKALVVEELLPEVLEWLQEEREDEDEVREQLLDVVEDHRDGYEMTSRLDRDHMWCDCDSSLVDILDGAGFYNATKKAVVAWIRDNQAIPKLTVQTPVNIKKWSRDKTTIPGVIVQVKEDGDYVVACPSEGQDIKGQCGFVIAWEKVEELNPSA